jgi:hypothetical protein
MEQFSILPLGTFPAAGEDQHRGVQAGGIGTSPALGNNNLDDNHERAMGNGAKLRTNCGPRPPHSAHLDGQRWTPAISGSGATTIDTRSGGQGVASSNLASPTM